MEQRLRADSETPEDVRARVRSGEHDGPTGGLASGYVQANLVVLPEEYAFDFLKFCVRNPRPCPILEVTDAGSPVPPVMAPGADLRADVPRYRVYEDGEMVDEPADILSYWREDLVSFLIGCSFTFEAALLDAGLRLPHLDQNRNVPMYVTDKECVPSGPFSGPMVVSMRPYRADEIPKAVAVSGRYPTMHGAPVHVGNPEALGIRRYKRAGVWGRYLYRGGRGAGFLGLRGDAAGGRNAGAASARDHAQPRPHVHHRPPQRGVRGLAPAGYSAKFLYTRPTYPAGPDPLPCP